MKRSRVCAALLCGAFGAALLTTPASASTLPNDLRHHWAQAQIYTLMEHGLITGYPDHTFRPDQTVTRQEAVGLVYGLLEEMGVDLDTTPQVGGAQTGVSSDDTQDFLPSQDELPTVYADLDNSWAKDKILCLESNGILSQDGTGLFHPFQDMTRGEAAQILWNCVTTWPDTFSLTPLENPPIVYDAGGHPNSKAIFYLLKFGVVSGRGDGGYYPDDPISRAEFSILLLNLAGYAVDEAPFEPLPTYTVIPTPYISQVYPSGAWVGCEPTSLLMGLKAKGYAQNVTLDDFLYAMPKTESNPAKGFVGSPYGPSETLRTTIYPAPLAEYGRQYGNVKDFSGKSVEELREEVLLGNPVVIYVTLYWKQPYYRNFNIEGTTQSLLRNNHAVLVCGYDSSTQQYYIADPYNINDRYHDYFYWISADILDPLYMVRQHAVAIE